MASDSADHECLNPAAPRVGAYLLGCKLIVPSL